jgi:hypothetical protein
MRRPWRVCYFGGFVAVVAWFCVWIVNDTFGLDRESDRFVSEVVAKITQNWDERLLIDYAAPALKNEILDGKLRKLFDRLSRFGACLAVEKIEGEATVRFTLSGREISAAYSTVARYRHGLVRVTLHLVRPRADWRIQYIRIDAIANEAGSV